MSLEQRRLMAYEAQTHYSQLFEEVTDAYLSDPGCSQSDKQEFLCFLIGQAKMHVTLNVDLQAVTLGEAMLIGRLVRELDVAIHYKDLFPSFTTDALISASTAHEVFW